MTTFDANSLNSAPSAIAEPALPLATSKPDTFSESIRAICNTNEEFGWRKIDSLRFFFQILLTITILGFCLGKMNTPDQTDKNNTAYWGAITSLIAWWMPSPGNGKNTTNSDAKE